VLKGDDLPTNYNLLVADCEKLHHKWKNRWSAAASVIGKVMQEKPSVTSMVYVCSGALKQGNPAQFTYTCCVLSEDQNRLV